MRDRLLKFLNKEKLSSARFAEIIDVQPSSISHILSGRNKPGFEFIRKTLISFPSLNAEWLILGKGAMFKNQDIQGDLFDGTTFEEKDIASIGDNKTAVEDEIENEKVNNKSSEQITNVKNRDSNIDYIGKHNDDGLETNVNKSKFVKRIVILYSDKSFSEYFPE